MNDRPFCLHCGYDLTGLDLPRSCPECGDTADPARQQADARQWAHGRHAWMWLASRRVPPGVIYVLHDPVSVRKGRRRAVLLWLPAILTACIVFIGICIEIESSVKVWYYVKSDPDRLPHRVSVEVETDRPYNFNLHLFHGGLFAKPVPATWVQVVEKRRQRVHFTWAPDLDFVAIGWGAAPLCMLLFGYLSCRSLLAVLARRVDAQRDCLALRRSLRTCVRLMMGPSAAAAWLWLAMTMGAGLTWVREAPAPGLSDLVGWGTLLACGLFVLGMFGTWVRLVSLDRARVFFSSRMAMGAALLLLNIAGPVIAMRLLFLVVR
jgi:hypothetical protein